MVEGAPGFRGVYQGRSVILLSVTPAFVHTCIRISLYRKAYSTIHVTTLGGVYFHWVRAEGNGKRRVCRCPGHALNMHACHGIHPTAMICSHTRHYADAPYAVCVPA